MPKSRFKQQNDFATFFQPKRMLRNDTLVILSNDNGGLRRSGAGPIFRAEKRSAQAFAHPLSQAQGGLVDCVCLLLEF